MRKYIIMLVILLINIVIVNGQGKLYEGPDDPAGDPAAVRVGWMNGNNVLLFYKNTTQLSEWPRIDAHKWPNTYNGCHMADNITLEIGARVFLENDSIPVTDLNEIFQRTDLDTLYFVQTSHNEGYFVDWDPTGLTEWGFKPVFGYFNINSETPAMSNDSLSWPPEGWPSRGNQTKWPGEWNGRFGRGVIYADLESYYVVNDAMDQEYVGEDDTLKYYPRPGVYIGDKKPDVSVYKGKPWGGLGLRVEVRGFQWNNPQSRDAVFWEYNIANISDYDIHDVYFGFRVDNGIGNSGVSGGGESSVAYYNKTLDLAYSWNKNGVGFGGIPTATFGIAYLESPGKAFDGIDNDDDGLIDEKRDNKAMVKVGPKDGIADLEKFLKFYKYKEEELHEHWDADEDQDWQDGNDANGNGVYDLGEDPGDDVGLDGVAPGDLNYIGPDADGTECNHKPDYVEGLGCEPNFAATDVSESDMLGLTSFSIYPTGDPNIRPQNDKEQYQKLASNKFDEYDEIVNLIELFASGPFSLYKGRTERYSMAIVHSYDPIEALNSESHTALSLFKKKEIVQVIYEKDYRFAQPPKLPTLHAIAQDGKVILQWDDVADKLTIDPFVGRKNDFEGYKIYKATDPKFSDCEVVTDGFGNVIGKKPVFQCDKIDHIVGYTEFGTVGGQGYYLGDDTGIKHYWVDNAVQNGRTYYYAIVAYDYGIPDLKISPSENNVVLELDESENIKRLGINVAVVTPHQVGAGYKASEVEIDSSRSNLIGTAPIHIDVIDKNKVISDAEYKIKFGDKILDYYIPNKIYRHKDDKLYVCNGLYVYRNDTLIYKEDSSGFSMMNIIQVKQSGSEYKEPYYYFNPDYEIATDIFDGMQIRFNLGIETAEYDSVRSGWLKGNSPINIHPAPASKYLPWDYDIVYLPSDSVYKSRSKILSMVTDRNGRTVNKDSIITDYEYNFYVENRSNFIDSLGEYEKLDLLINDVNGNGVYDKDEDYILVGVVKEYRGKVFWTGTIFSIDYFDVADEKDMPEPNDVFCVRFKRPYTSMDSLVYRVNKNEGYYKDLEAERMDSIQVVPNPYVATNAMEPAVSNPYLNQKRRIIFTHVPTRSIIKIYTVSGVLVDEITVDNTADNGIVYWDLVSKEGLDIAAGVYIYHIKSLESGREKIGKFAIIK